MDQLPAPTSRADVHHRILNDWPNLLQKPFMPADMEYKVREVIDKSTD